MSDRTKDIYLRTHNFFTYPKETESIYYQRKELITNWFSPVLDMSWKRHSDWPAVRQGSEYHIAIYKRRYFGKASALLRTCLLYWAGIYFQNMFVLIHLSIAPKWTRWNLVSYAETTDDYSFPTSDPNSSARTSASNRSLYHLSLLSWAWHREKRWTYLPE